jgi:hypothetical protein
MDACPGTVEHLNYRLAGTRVKDASGAGYAGRAPPGP